MAGYNHLIIASSVESSGLPAELQTPSVDVRHMVVEQLGIGDARDLIEQSHRRAFGQAAYTFVIVAQNITPEAQNALLKLFEEPPNNTIFYLVIPRQSMLLPTLRSRFVDQVDRKDQTVSKETMTFLDMNLNERLAFIADQAKKQPEALGQLVSSLGQVKDLSPTAKRSLLLVDKYVYNRGASRKALLEELALSL